MNLSSHKLTDDERALLSYGLKFIPTPEKIDTEELYCDSDWFSLKVRRQYFFNRYGKDNTFIPFKPKSDWEPPQHKIPGDIIEALDDIIKSTKDMNHTLDDKNLPDHLYKALKTLRKNTDIVIKKADKGSAIVIQDRENYVKEAERQLQDPEYYMTLIDPLYPDTAKTFTRILEELEALHGEVGGTNTMGICGISQKQLEHLKPEAEEIDIRPRIFYLLPKIHKDPAKWKFPYEIPPGRPIVSDCSSEGYNIAAFIDYFLQPIASSHKSYIKDTNHFLSILSDLEVQEGDLLVTADVDAMYTNIDHEMGLEAIRKALEQNPPTTERPRIPDSYLLQLLEISLKQNDFVFNGVTYLQLKGTAMGKKFAPSYANIFMAQWEDEILQRSHLKPLTWNRFLDDVFMLWRDGESKLNEFFTFLNGDNPCIKLKQEVSDTHVDFLDTTVYKGEDISDTKRLSTKVYNKPTDTLELLHKDSYHPAHTFPGIIKSQILRYHRLNSKQEHFEASCNKLFKALQPRGYTMKFLKGIKKQTMEEIRDPDIKQTRRYPHILEPPPQPYKASRCGNRRCEACPAVQEGSTFKSVATDKTYHIQHNLDCGSKEVIYLITCTRCNLQYVGETSLTIRQRLWKYRNKIERTEYDDNMTLIEQHFRPEFEHDGMADLTIMPIDQRTEASGDETRGMYIRQEREQFWINTLKTKEPHGLNVKLRGEDKVLPLVTTYTKPTQEWANNILREWRERVQPIHRQYLPNRMLAAYRRNVNLNQYLCPSQLKVPIWLCVEKQLQREANYRMLQDDVNTLSELHNTSDQEDEPEDLDTDNINILNELLNIEEAEEEFLNSL